MATIDPSNIQLSDAQRKRLAQVVEKSGRTVSDVLDEAISHVPVQDDEAAERLRNILNGLSQKAKDVPEDELDALMTEACEHARHGKS